MIDNQTPFEACCWPTSSLANDDLAVVVVSGRFDLPLPTKPPPERLVPCAVQQPPRVEDVYWGDPVESSLRYEGQAVPERPGTDVHVHGHACAPGGVPTGRVDVGVRVGPITRAAAVFGERIWTEGAFGWQPTTPVPFDRMPLSYERCFGGRTDAARGSAAGAGGRNPVGRGLFESARAAKRQRLPNVEDPSRLLRSPADRPAPQGFGPIPRHWAPRHHYAGTYDEVWVRTRAPLWPDDVRPQLLSAATPGMCAIPYLTGGEPVALVGMHPDGPIRFTLPSFAMRAEFRLRSNTVERAMVLDEVLLEPDEGVVTLTWRANAPVVPDMGVLRAVTVREEQVA